MSNCALPIGRTFRWQDFYLALGFCEEERYGRIPVGGVGYDDKRCERIKCTPGGMVYCCRVQSGSDVRNARMPPSKKKRTLSQVLRTCGM
ncbi:hypothetical protein CEXT_607181 [Caerostris extrusa]|uniref:Uncharacterized protein n=1 Tax=Caerostris extrusa TaxID=172846 RepID=A0AAV4VFQ5_CAEEX|nr:hypothetical protein CEXT_607181 [Caerostris extrusa]